MKITVYGSGCVMCGGMDKNIKEAILDLGIKEIEMEKVCNFEKMEELGIKETPAIAIDDKVVFSGQIPDVEKMKEILSDHL
ncbi:MAG: thioredoxin family protein [Candidatus Paceibacterota bacterium]